MESTPYLAHRSEDGREQTVFSHLEGTAELCRSFAEAFDAGDQGYLAGFTHDLGKYSDAFQKRLNGGPKVDHSTAGAFECWKRNQLPAAFCIAGHHSGLPDCGGRGDLEGSSLMARLNRARRTPLPPYDRWQQELSFPTVSLPHQFREFLPAAFYTRMLYSCLVDADFLDTERFMSVSEPLRGGGEPLAVLLQKLEAYIAPWFPPKKELNERRCEILNGCLEQGSRTDPGLFTLTVPTGGGKTVASLAFALRHGCRNGMRRVIYVIPYTSIIEQTAQVFREILGNENVLEHHSNVQYEISENSTPDEIRLAHATENWDAPVIVTTAVQFFESLYSNRSSQCRKLHNIANSVVIFDEAQMLPVPYLKPCVHAISQLVAHYRVSAVLCTATQPSLAPLFADFLPGVQARELCPQSLFSDLIFQRVTFRQVGALTWEELAEEMRETSQALCIVNTRKSAQALYEQLGTEDAFHLSTLLCPAHRKQILSEIRRRLLADEPCYVVSTSLIEAGVDVDFPAVFREEAGLDSVLQAAGRCNREGKRSAANSIVTVFCSEGKTPPLFSKQISAYRSAQKAGDDLTSKEAVQRYFDALLFYAGEAAQDKDDILKLMQTEPFPFETVSKRFHLIDSNTRTVYIPWGDGVSLMVRLKAGERSRSLFRSLGQYGVSVYEDHFRRLESAGALEVLEDGSALLRDLSLYSEQTGLSPEADSGQALFI